MRAIAALIFAALGIAFSYWAFAYGSGDPVEWAFVTAFGLLMCHDLWARFFARGAPDREPGLAGRAARMVFRHRASLR